MDGRPEAPWEVYFRRSNDAVVYAPPEAPHEVSLVHRYPDGQWHCALCDSNDCRHTRAAERARSRQAPRSR